MTVTLETTIREVVATDYRTASVFQRFGIDFCCHGCQTIEQGCRTAGADRERVLAELTAAIGTAAAGAAHDFNNWTLRRLTAHIVSIHHEFVRRATPPLLQHTKKIAAVHGERHTELPYIADLVDRVAVEMTEHMMKEERMLFPFIDALERAQTDGASAPSAPFGTVANPIHMMETEHEFVGDAMAEMRHLTNGFEPPADACATYRVCLQKLDAFERDLHQHVHLENNLLFPKASALETTLAASAR